MDQETTRDAQAVALGKFLSTMIDKIITETDSKIVEVDPVIYAVLAAFPTVSEQEATALAFREVEKRGYGVFWRSAHHPVSDKKGA